jgi:hypothetical protein
MKVFALSLIIAVLGSSAFAANPNKITAKLSEAQAMVHASFSGKFITLSGTTTDLQCADGSYGCVDEYHGSIDLPNGKYIKLSDSNNATQIANAVCDFSKEWQSLGNVISCIAL